ncbi:hypothetical protein ED733_000417 [Metarhizium rileyi]|uniref:Uncharacterized protein n=1 Tax=Metarhizium rileyi (strain RCEF 4871) TaxID=1649241 RepID=A0A5C6GD66_METRR|nr:hypothetical protein ED733_000417 [Metarhizium rileyi]
MCNQTQDMVKETSKTLDDLYWDSVWAIINGFEHFEGRQPQETILRALNLRNTAVFLNSVILAHTMMKYCADFDGRVVPLCADENVPIPKRVAVIEELEREALILEAACALKDYQFGEINTTFQTMLLGPSSTLTKTSTRSFTPDTAVQNLLPDVDFRTWVLTYATSLPGPLSDSVKIGGLLAVGTLECKTASLVISAAAQSQCQKPVSLQGRPIDIPERIADVERYTTVHRKYWRFTADDAKEIASWLREGADMARWPEYMCKAINEGKKLYFIMAAWFSLYIDRTATEHPDILRLEAEDSEFPSFEKLRAAGLFSHAKPSSE